MIPLCCTACAIGLQLKCKLSRSSLASFYYAEREAREIGVGSLTVSKTDTVVMVVEIYALEWLNQLASSLVRVDIYALLTVDIILQQPSANTEFGSLLRLNICEVILCQTKNRVRSIVDLCEELGY